MLHPARRPLGPAPTLVHRDVEFTSDGTELRGWLFPAREVKSGTTVVYLHGSGDNRASGNWIAERLVASVYDELGKSWLEVEAWIKKTTSSGVVSEPYP